MCIFHFTLALMSFFQFLFVVKLFGRYSVDDLRCVNFLITAELFNSHSTVPAHEYQTNTVTIVNMPHLGKFNEISFN